MTTATFRPEISVQIAEAVTGNGIEAFDIRPTLAAKRAMADYHLKFSQLPTGFVLYAQYDAGAAGARRAPFTGPVSLTFGLWLRSHNFFKTYHPDLNATTGPALMLTNRAGNGAPKDSGSLAQGVTVEAVDGTRISGARMTARVDTTLPGPPTNLALASYYTPAQALTDIPINAPAGSTAASVEIELNAHSFDRFTLSPKPPNTAKTSVVRNDELAASGATAILDLELSDFPSAVPPTGRSYFAHFRRRN